MHCATGAGKLMKRQMQFALGLLCAVLLLPTEVAAVQSTAAPERVLADVLAGRRPPADLAVRFRTGRPGYRGQTTLEVRADGKMNLTTDHGGEIERRGGRLSENGVKVLLQLLLEAHPWTRPPATDSNPADAEELNLHLVTLQGDLDVESDFPITAAVDLPDLQALVDAYGALTTAIRSGR